MSIHIAYTFALVSLDLKRENLSYGDQAANYQKIMRKYTLKDGILNHGMIMSPFYLLRMMVSYILCRCEIKLIHL